MAERKWTDVRDGIVADIRSGLYPIGSRIPSPPDLVTRFDCDRNTIRRATGYLRDIGVLVTRVGDGTYVASDPPATLPEPARRPSLEDRVADLERWRAEVEQREREQ